MRRLKTPFEASILPFYCTFEEKFNNSIMKNNLVMKKCFFSLLIMIATNSIAQLADHYQFEDNGKKLNLKQRMEQTQTPGIVFYIDHGDGFESLALGKKGPETMEDMTAKTLFPVGAISNFPMQMELLRMQAAGLLSLDDPVKQYIPELKDKRLFKKEISIKDLILMNVKLNGPYKPTGYGKDVSSVSLNEILTVGNQDFKKGMAIKSSKNKKHNGECSYAILCQLIIERVHQRPFADIIQENILTPIGMTASFYATELNAEQSKRAALGTVKGRPLPDGYRRYEALGSMGLWTTTKDVCKLIRHVMDAAQGKDNRILSIDDAKKGLTSQKGFCSLIFHVSDDHTIYGGGNAKGFYTCIEADLEKDIVQAVFSNADLVWKLVNFSIGQTGNYIDQKRGNQKTVAHPIKPSGNTPPGKIEFIGNAGSDNVFTVEKWAFTKIENPDQPEKIRIEAVLDINSITCSWKELESSVKKKKDYFFTKKFPEAKVSINGATLLENGNYTTDALLELKGIRKIVPLEFSISKAAPYRVQAQGVVFRSAFKFSGDGPKEEVPVMIDVVLEASSGGD